MEYLTEKVHAEDIYDILDEINPNIDFRNCEDFIESSVLSSLDVVLLIDMLEKKYGIIVDGLEIVPENFNNVEAIIALIGKSEKNESQI